MASNNPLRVNTVEEESNFRNAVHEVIALILADKPGCTLIDIAEKIDVSVKTISNAFNKTHSLSQTFLTRLGRYYGPHFLDPVAKLSGGRMVPLDADEEADALPSLSASVHQLCVATSPKSEGGASITHRELLAALPELREAQRALTTLILKAEAIAA